MRPEFFDWQLTDDSPFTLMKLDVSKGAVSRYLDFHSSIHLNILLSGDCSLEIGCKKISCLNKCMITIPWELHGQQSTRNGCHLLVTAIRPQNLYAAMLGERNKLKSIIMLPPDLRHQLIWKYSGESLKNCIAGLQKNRARLLQWHAIIEFFAHLVTDIPSEDIPVIQNNSNFELTPVFRKMFSPRKERFSAEDAAKLCSMSLSRFRQLFKITTGQPFAKYELHYRLSLAKELIAQNTLTLKSIAEELGFHDICHLSNCFKKTFGITPRQYSIEIITRKNSSNSLGY